MKTLTKVLLLAFWLLGAGTGWPSTDPAPSSEATTYHIALVKGIDVHVSGHHVTVQMTAGWGSGMAMSAAVPRWVAALSSHVHSADGSLATVATEASPPSGPTMPRGS